MRGGVPRGDRGGAGRRVPPPVRERGRAAGGRRAVPLEPQGDAIRAAAAHGGAPGGGAPDRTHERPAAGRERGPGRALDLPPLGRLGGGDGTARLRAARGDPAPEGRAAGGAGASGGAGHGGGSVARAGRGGGAARGGGGLPHTSSRGPARARRAGGGRRGDCRVRRRRRTAAGARGRGRAARPAGGGRERVSRSRASGGGGGGGHQGARGRGPTARAVRCFPAERVRRGAVQRGGGERGARRARAPRQEVQPAGAGGEERARQDPPPERARPRAGARQARGGGVPLDSGVHRRAHRGDRRQPGGLVARALPSLHGAAARRHPPDRREGADAGGAVQPVQPAAGQGPAARVHGAVPPQHAHRDRGADHFASRGGAGRRADGAGSRCEAARARAAADGPERDARAGAGRLSGRSPRRLGAQPRRLGAAGGERRGGGGRTGHGRAGARGAGGPVVARGAPLERLPHQRDRRVESGRHQEPREAGVGLARRRGPPHRGSALMAIKGSLKEASLPDVLQLLSLGQKTGCLSIADRSNFGYIYFDKGRICYASIVNRRDRLGDILVKHQKIRSDQLDAAIHRQSKERDKKLGEILVGMGVISQEDLERYMRVQIEESVYYLFTWTQGTFNFESEVRPERQDFLVNINPESLLLEGARRVDEWSLIEKKIPSFDLIFTVDKDRLAISEAALTETQQRVLPLLDGARDMHQVIEDSGLGEVEGGKALYGRITAGFLHRAGRTASPEDVKMTDARVAEHRNLGIAFYKTGMLDEAAREFRRVAELRATDANAHFFIGLVALKQARWREAMDALRLAAEKGGSRPALLHNLGLAHEPPGPLGDAGAPHSEAAERARADAKGYLGWGVGALKRGGDGGGRRRGS